MYSELQTISTFSAAATGALFSAIWEGTVLAFCVAAGLRFFPRLSAAARSAIWFNLFTLLVLLHLVPLFTGPMEGAESGSGAPLQLDLRWSLAVAALWAAMSFWRGIQLILSAAQLHRMARRATPLAISPALHELLFHAPGGRRVEVCASNEVARPSVLGFFHPRILLPPLVVEKLTPGELQQVVMHEMEHLRRADDWTNLLQKIGLVLFPLNPVLLWVERRLCMERELACDDQVMRSGPGRKAYAICLTHLAEYSMLRRSLTLALGAWERRPELVRRVQRILAEPVRAMGRKPALAAAGGVIAASLAFALMLAHSPQLVSFVPSVQNAHATVANAATDLHPAMAELAGAPHLVKAVMPREALQPTAKPHQPRLRTAAQVVTGRAVHLQTQQAFIVMTEWTEMEPAPRLVMTISQDQDGGPMIVPARYAVVSTPSGWLILQI